MSIVPVVLDSRLAYLGGGARSGSALLLPTPHGRLLDEVARALAEVTPRPLVVVTGFDPFEAYERELRAGAEAIELVCASRDLWQCIDRLEASDTLLMVAPTRYPADGFDLRDFCGSPLDSAGPVRHLLAFDASSVRTKELVQTGRDGRVRRIQRFFDPMTWPFASGVVASFIPVSYLRLIDDVAFDTLEELRAALALRGIAAHDVPLDGDCYSLTDEAGALALCRRRLLRPRVVRRSARHPCPVDNPLRSSAAFIDPSARVVGPVSVAAGARIEAGALVIGPSVIATGATIGRGAVVAQSIIVADAVIGAAAVISHRVADTDHPTRANDDRRHDMPGIGSPRESDASTRRRERYAKLKAAAEPLVAAAVLVAISPLMLAIAAIVGMTSTGPIFYGDVREGKDGNRFYCWKFRTMLVNADEMQRALKAQQQMDGPQFKMDRDPRVTAVGRWLRRVNFDELPQLWNVCRAEMSFVGPRPSPFRENQICIPWRIGRLSVRPGITGLWQVCRHDRELGDFHQWIYYDLLYVRHFSALLDVRILAGTLLTLGGKWPLPLATMIGLRGEHGAAHIPLAPRAGERRATPTRGDVSAVG